MTKTPDRLATFTQPLISWLRSLRPHAKLAWKSNQNRSSSSSNAVLQTAAYASVIIPALNEEKRIAEVVAYARSDPATAEVIVVDDSSIDATVAKAKAAGAKVMTSSMLGKGASMADGLTLASTELVVYLDGDLAGLRDGIITDLCKPLIQGEADFVKGSFGRTSGRVTELTAKPMLKIFFPELAQITQPLGGIIAARKNLLASMKFEDGYGVDIGLLIDSFLAGAKIRQVDIGSLEHDSQSLGDLTYMANEITRVIFGRAKAMGRLHVEQISRMHELQRRAAAEMDYILSRKKGRNRLLLLDMDGTVTSKRYALELAIATARDASVLALLDGSNDDANTRSRKIAKEFQYIHKNVFEEVARNIPIRPGVVEFVNQARRKGFMVGLVSDSYFVGAEIVRRRIFADFALAHTISFQNEVCDGELGINSAFLSSKRPDSESMCKSNVLRRFIESQETVTLTTWAVGDNRNDLAMMELADRAFTIDPKIPELKNNPKVRIVESFSELIPLLPDEIAGPQTV